MLTVTLALMMSVVAAEPVAIPAEGQILQSLHGAHPRLIAVPADVQRVKKLIAEDRRAAEIYKAVKHSADSCLQQPTVEYKLVGPRLLGESRKCMERVYALATVYRITGERRYADRAIKEILAAAAFDDWHPSHFLDTAEMTHGVAIGYDWLYDILSPTDRQTLRRAIVEHGLREGEKVYRKQKGWAHSDYNWNQVCNGGMTIGALAVAEDEPQLAAYIVHQAANSVQLAMRQFAPDGGWAEGPGYWNYATIYNVFMLAGLQSALGTDFGLSQIAGFDLAGDFRIHMIGPTQQAFNFADGGSGAGRSPQMFWFAQKFNKPLYAWHERDYLGQKTAAGLWWFDPRGSSSPQLATDRWFRHVDVVTMRSKWDDPRAVYVGLKGGDNKANHSHLELGNFVLDADGQRWAMELGGDDYNLPGYFGKERWTYYRLGTIGQNTLLIDGKNQDPKAVAPVIAFSSQPQWASAVVDLSAAYGQQVRKAQRGIALVDRRQVLVQDDIEAAPTANIAWQMHTRAKIALDGRRAVLSQDGAKLVAQILSPAEAVFATESATPPAPQGQNRDVTKLVVKVHGSDKLLRLAVLLTPAAEGSPQPPKVIPLAQWPSQAPTP
jgi:hypothetical protein